MKLKDIERMGDNIQGGCDYFVVIETPRGETNIYSRFFTNLLSWVKKNYNEDLTAKDNSKEKITGVKIFRR